MSIIPDALSEAHFKRHRYPAEIIAYAVWLYFRFPLSVRHVEELLAERGIEVSFQTVAEWATKLGVSDILCLRPVSFIGLRTYRRRRRRIGFWPRTIRAGLVSSPRRHD